MKPIFLKSHLLGDRYIFVFQCKRKFSAYFMIDKNDVFLNSAIRKKGKFRVLQRECNFLSDFLAYLDANQAKVLANIEATLDSHRSTLRKVKRIATPTTSIDVTSIDKEKLAFAMMAKRKFA